MCRDATVRDCSFLVKGDRESCPWYHSLKVEIGNWDENIFKPQPDAFEYMEPFRFTYIVVPNTNLSFKRYTRCTTIWAENWCHLMPILERVVRGGVVFVHEHYMYCTSVVAEV